MVDREKSAIFDAITKVKGSLLKISPSFERIFGLAVYTSHIPWNYSRCGYNVKETTTE
jgi:hypothetical protein